MLGNEGQFNLFVKSVGSLGFPPQLNNNCKSP